MMASLGKLKRSEKSTHRKTHKTGNMKNRKWHRTRVFYLLTYYDFYHEDYDFYFWALAELEQNNELLLSHEFTKEETKIINPSKIFKSEECIICLTNQPIILFCNCGHIPICTECYKLKSLSTCPICKTENEIIRMLE